MITEPLATDTKFFDSPDTGWPECTCSRCGNMITEGEMPLRMFVREENAEYRYCEPCQSKYFGINYAPRYDFDNSFYDDPNGHPYVD